MKTYSKIQYLIIASFFIFSMLIYLTVKFSNYTPIAFVLLFVPFLMFKMLNVTFSSSTYIMKNHPDFYNKYKTITFSLEGKVVNLFWADNKEIKMLNDSKVEDFKYELKKVRQLLLLCFLGFFLLGLLTVFFA